MKNLVIIIGTILLGTILFDMMVGDGTESLKNAAATAMRYHISQYAVQGMS
ncbi:MAG: hypothetical protein HFE73_02725 [Firmicutes bacterium]|nr:hypothetical protein [Bacillota bacterium]